MEQQNETTDVVTTEEVNETEEGTGLAKGILTLCGAGLIALGGFATYKYMKYKKAKTELTEVQKLVEPVAATAEESEEKPVIDKKTKVTESK